MLNRHVIADRAYLATARLLMGEAFSEGAVSPSFQEHLGGLSFELPMHDGAGLHEFSIDSQAGPMEAAYRIHRWEGPGAPTIIWHHPAGEVPFDAAARTIFPAGEPPEANIVLVRAPFHRSRKEFRAGMAYLSRLVAMLAAAVEITERLIVTLPLSDRPRVMVAGYGQGGFVTNRHRLHYASAGTYVPLMAGTAHGELWLSSLPTAAIAKQRPDTIRQALNFQNEWAELEPDNVHAVLGRHDQVCRWDTQRPSYGSRKVAAWDVGHVTGWRSPGKIRLKLRKHLAESSRPLTPGTVSLVEEEPGRERQ